jgi:hypothetical protein
VTDETVQTLTVLLEKAKYNLRVGIARADNDEQRREHRAQISILEAAQEEVQELCEHNDTEDFDDTDTVEVHGAPVNIGSAGQQCLNCKKVLDPEEVR